MWAQMWICRKSLGQARLSGNCTVTPGSAILVGESGRLMVPMEKCLVHLVPVHKLALPADISDTEFGNLGAKHQAFDGSPGLRVCVIVGRSFVDDLVFTFWLTWCKCEALGSLSFMLRIERCLHGCVFPLGARMCKDSWRNHCYPNERATQNLNRAFVRIFGNVI